MVDAYSASPRRPYRSLPHGAALEELLAGRGGQHDPDVVGEFLRMEAAVLDLMDGLARTAPTVHLHAAAPAPA